MERKNFMFYLNWEEQINLMTDPELRKFILNLIRYHKGEPVELVSKVDKLTWAGIVPALEANNIKYEERIKANRENGKKGGAPIGNKNAKKEITTQNNPNNPIKDNREVISDNREEINENGEMLTDDSQLENGNSEEDKSEKINDNSSNYTGNYTGAILGKNEVEEINNNINSSFDGTDVNYQKYLFKFAVREKLQEKILATGYLKDGLFKYLKNNELKSIQQRMDPEEYKSVEPLLLEYLSFQ